MCTYSKFFYLENLIKWAEEEQRRLEKLIEQHKNNDVKCNYFQAQLDYVKTLQSGYIKQL